MNERPGLRSDQLIHAFIELNAPHVTSSKREQLLWVEEKLAAMMDGSPEDVWNFVCAVVETDVARESFPALAAGIFEELMSRNGDAFIERVEILNRQSPAFRWMLGGVWKGGMSPELWRRFQQIPGRTPW